MLRTHGRADGHTKHALMDNVKKVYLTNTVCRGININHLHKSMLTSSVNKTPKKLRTSKGDYSIKQWSLAITSLFVMGTAI